MQSVNFIPNFRRAAIEEFVHAIKWYENRERGLGIKFKKKVRAIVDTILTQPDLYPLARSDIRHALVYPFPYCVYYRVRSHRVVILSVFHESRDPKEWQSRA